MTWDEALELAQAALHEKRQRTKSGEEELECATAVTVIDEIRVHCRGVTVIDANEFWDAMHDPKVIEMQRKAREIYHKTEQEGRRI